MKLVGKGDAAPCVISAEARALLERILAENPLAIGIMYEAADSADFQTVPRMDCVRFGLAEMLDTVIDTDG